VPDSRSGEENLNRLKVIAEGEARDRNDPVAAGIWGGGSIEQLSDSAEVREELPLIVAPAQASGGRFRPRLAPGVQFTACARHATGGPGVTLLRPREPDRIAHKPGRDGVGLNRGHALFDDRAGDCSHYVAEQPFVSQRASTSMSTNFLNPRRPGVEAALAHLRACDVVDYPAWRA